MQVRCSVNRKKSCRVCKIEAKQTQIFRLYTQTVLCVKQANTFHWVNVFNGPSVPLFFFLNWPGYTLLSEVFTRD